MDRACETVFVNTDHHQELRGQRAIIMRTENSSVRRSVNSLQQLYGFVVALAVAQAVRMTFVQQNQLVLTVQWLPVFVAVIFTIVPFFHGMNRHLDRCYISRGSSHIQGMLLGDFLVFFVEAALLFAFASSVRSGLQGFVILAAVLLIDTVWAMISHWIHYRDIEPSTKRWAVINTSTIIVIAFLYPADVYSDSVKLWLLMVVAISRTISDYAWSWEFYFPQVSE